MKYIKVYKSEYNLGGEVKKPIYVSIDKISYWADGQIFIDGVAVPIDVYSSAEEIKEFIDQAMDDEGATSIEDGRPQKKENENEDEEWEMRISGIPVEPQVGELEEVWKNVTVEILRMSDGEYSVGWYKQEDSEQIV